MRPSIFLRRPQGRPQSIEVLSLSPDQYGLVLGPASVLVLFGGKEIPIEGTYGDAWMETWSSLQEWKKEDLLSAVHGRLHSLLRSRAETFYNLSVEKYREGQWTYLHDDATVTHGPLQPQESKQAMVPGRQLPDPSPCR